MIEAYRGDLLPVTPCCARCDRRGYIRVRTADGVEWRCSWHVTESLPLSVKRRIERRLSWHATLTGARVG